MLSINGHFDRWILGLVLAFEALLCSSFYSREIARYPPSGFDQTTFLIEAYHLEENILSHGLGDVWKAVRSKGHPSGLLLPIEGALSGLVLGGARWPQLAVNFAFFSARYRFLPFIRPARFGAIASMDTPLSGLFCAKPRRGSSGEDCSISGWISPPIAFTGSGAAR